MEEMLYVGTIYCYTCFIPNNISVKIIFQIHLFLSRLLSFSSNNLPSTGFSQNPNSIKPLRSRPRASFTFYSPLSQG